MGIGKAELEVEVGTRLELFQLAGGRDVEEGQLVRVLNQTVPASLRIHCKK